MGAKARGFLLFTFAFSSVFIASAEILVPSKSPSREIEAPKPLRTKETECSHHHPLEKRAIGYPSDYSDNQEAEKRAPLGFTGMRGKKESDFDGYDKRAPIGFTGMRGKKESDKRGAPLGFTALRGKKDDFGSSESEKRAPLGFTGMRGKKEFEENEVDPEFEGSQDFFVNSGLFDDEETDGGIFDDTALEKRMTRAFHGMRRKDDDYNFKRAMGFLGMRGKKSPEIWAWDEFDKRAPQTGFFGMRGKKAPSNAFFGMRGKKAPNNAAFFGMRGKREIAADEREAIAA